MFLGFPFSVAKVTVKQNRIFTALGKDNYFVSCIATI